MTTSRARVFLASTTESLQLVGALATALDQQSGGGEFQAVPWNEGVFAPSTYTIPELIEHGRSCSFAVVIASADDVTISRAESQPSPRDNVVFEAGLFCGLIGLERTFVAVPQGVELRLPSDLKGLTTVRYPAAPDDEHPAQARAIVTQISGRMRKLGVLTATEAPPSSSRDGVDTHASLQTALERLRANVDAQGWSWSRKRGVLRVRPPGRPRQTLIIDEDPHVALSALGQFGWTLRSHGLRVHHAVLRLR